MTGDGVNRLSQLDKTRLSEQVSQQLVKNLGLACDQSQTCLLVFSVAVAGDSPQTVRQLLVQRIVILFPAGSWLS